MALVGVLEGVVRVARLATPAKDAAMGAEGNAAVVESELDDPDPGLAPFAGSPRPFRADLEFGYLRTKPGREA